MTRDQLRKKLLIDRRALSSGVARHAGLAASQRAWKLRPMQRAKRIGAYFPMRGELDCRGLIQQAWDRRRLVYLPVLHGSQLRFRAYTPGTRLVPNRFGIPEPAYGDELSAMGLDVAITPLVAFDMTGNRLGMGGGYYDRSFRFVLNRECWRHPQLVGFAFDMQRVTELDSFAWDIPLDAAVTETSQYIF